MFLTTIESYYTNFYTLVSQLVTILVAVIYSLNLFLKVWTAFSVENFLPSSPMRFLIQKLFLAANEAFKRATCIVSQRGGFKFGELSDHCFFWIISDSLCRHCWATHAVCTQPHASFWTAPCIILCQADITFCGNNWELVKWKSNAYKSPGSYI